MVGLLGRGDRSHERGGQINKGGLRARGKGENRVEISADLTVKVNVK